MVSGRQGAVVDREVPGSLVHLRSTGVLVTTMDGRFLWANAALESIVGGSTSAFAASPVPGRVIPDGAAVDVPWTGPDGRARWLHVACHGVSTSSAPLLQYEVTDISERHALRRRLASREHRIARVEALAGVGTWEWDVTTDEVRWSAQLLTLFGYPEETVLDYPTYRSLVHPDDIAMIEATLADALASGASFHYTHRMFLADRSTMRVFECHGEVTTAADGTPVRVLGTAHDITDERRTQDRLAFLASRDPLTGLRNRRSITTRLDDCFTSGTRDGALLLIDVDHFKDINDLRGHPVGDEVMRALGQVLRDHAGPDAVLGRLGGDEFAVVLPGADVGRATDVAERLRAAIAAADAVGGGQQLRVTVSIGVGMVAQAGHADALLANADLALYEAKRAGRNRARLFSAEQYQHAADRVSEARRVRDALDSGRMGLHLQPIVALGDWRIVRHEVLLRLEDGLVPSLGPIEFLAAVRGTDVMSRLDRWVVDRAVEALAGDAARRADLRLSVNTSTRSLEDPSFADHIIEALRTHDVAPDRLGVEITETAAVTNLDAARQLMTRLSAAGCEIALDDFGAGFSSVVHLKDLPFSAVKIAGQIVREVDRHPADAAIVDAVVRLARALDVRTVAEQVDRAPLPGMLTRLGVDHAQGFHLGRPRPLADVLAAVAPVAG